MQKLKILIIEDEAIPAAYLSEILADLGYLVTDIASDYDTGLLALKRNLPDLILMDINLGKESKDGIELAKSINALEQNIPLIFISANFEKVYRDRAYETAHANFLVKPYNKNQIELSVESALRGFDQASSAPEILTGNKHLFIKDKATYVRLNASDICAIVADRSISHIYTNNKKRTVSTHLDNLLKQFDVNQLIRIHRSHAVNLQKIVELNFNEGQVTIGLDDKDMKLNIGPKYKEELSNRIKTIKSS